MMGVRSLRASSKSSVSAARPRSSEVAGLDGPLRLDDVAGQIEQRLQELDADQQALVVLLAQLFEPLAEGAEPGFVLVFAETARDLDLDLRRLLVGVGRAEHRVQYVGIEHQGLQVVADGVDVDVPVDEVDGLGAERVPEELARAGRGFHRFVDLAQPAVVGLVRLQARIGRDRFPEAREEAVVGGEAVARGIVGQAFLGGDQPLVAGHGAVDAGNRARHFRTAAGSATTSSLMFVTTRVMPSSSNWIAWATSSKMPR